VSSPARESILSNIRAALGRPAEPDPTDDAGAAEPARSPVAPVIPAIAHGTHAELVARFITNAEAAAATVSRCAPGDVGDAVAQYLAGIGLPLRAMVPPDPRLDGLDRDSRFTLDRRAAPTADDTVGIAHALAGIAETGTILMASGPASPATLNVLPETHIVVLRASDIVGGLEDGWSRLRHAHPDGLPRTVHMITGPSRTGDIEQTLQLGAHGPRQLHVVLVDDGADGQGA